MRQRLRSGVALTGAIAAALLAVPLPASAHVGSSPLVVTQAGPFVVSAYDGVAAPNGQTLYRATLTLAASRAEVSDATVAVTADLVPSASPSPSASVVVPLHAGPVAAANAPNKYGVPGAGANSYAFLLPDAGAGTWRVTLAVTAPSGSATATFDVHGTLAAQQATATKQASGLLHALFVAGPIMLLVAASLAVLVRRVVGQRKADDASPGAAG